MFILATMAFAWGLSLATYRLFATYNDWPMGEWQAHRPGLPIAIGLFAMASAVAFGLARSSVTGDATAIIVPLFGLLCALAWTAIARIGAQCALILAPLSVLALMAVWYTSALHLAPGVAQPASERPLVLPPLER